MNAIAMKRASANRRRPVMRIAPCGTVTFEGTAIGAVQAHTTADGHTIWGYRLTQPSGEPSDLVTVLGNQWAAARACTVAHLIARNATVRELRQRRAA
jgi:hypothetical protein